MPNRLPGAARRNAAIRQETADEAQRKSAAVAQANQANPRLTDIDSKRQVMTPAEVRTAVADVAVTIQALIRTL